MSAYTIFGEFYFDIYRFFAFIFTDEEKLIFRIHIYHVLMCKCSD